MAIIPYSKIRPRSVFGYVQWSDDELDGISGYNPYVHPLGDDSDIGSFNTNWRQMVKNGQDATTGRTATRFAVRNRSSGLLLSHHTDGSLNGEYTSTMAGLIALCEGSAGNVIPGNYPIGSALVNEALTKFHKKIQNESNSLQGGVIFGELGETIRLFKSNTLSFKKGALRFLKGEKATRFKARRKHGSRLTNDPTVRNPYLAGALNRYLEFVFGVQPLVHDIDDAVDIFVRKTSPMSRPLGASAKLKFIGDNYSADRLVGPKASLRYTLYVTDTVEQKVSMGGAIAVMQERLSAQNLGIGLSDFVPTLWELLPYSFVVDYFTNVGDFLGSLGSRPRMTYTYMTKKSKVVRRLVAGPARYWGSTYISSSGYGGSASIVREDVNRIVQPSLNLSFQLEIPGRGSLKWLNLGVLSGALLHRSL